MNHHREEDTMRTHLLLAALTASVFCLLSCPFVWAEEPGEEILPPKPWSVAGLVEPAPTGDEIPPPSVGPPAFPVINGIPDTPDVLITTVTDRTITENSIFVSPLDDQIVLCANNSSDWPVTQIFGTQVGWSTDGGVTWTSQNEGPGGFRNKGDPAAVINLSGHFIVGYITSQRGQGVSISTDTGASWSHVTVATVPDTMFDLLDKNHLTVDNVASSPYQGNLYSAWTEFIDGGPNEDQVVISTSSDGGSTWSTPEDISSGLGAGSHNQGVNIQTGPNGEVYATWAVYDIWPADEVAIGFTSSMDGGASWAAESRILTSILGIRSTTLPNENSRANSYPTMAVDVSGGPRNGWIYIFWTNQGVPGVNSGDADIYMIRSTDGGASWSTPVRVNDDATTNAQWFPWATCNPTTGDLYVIFYDRRDDPGDLLTTAYVACSSDGGSTWDNFRVGDAQFTPGTIPGFMYNYMGDYLGIAARGCHVYPHWSDDRSGVFTAYVSPLFVDNEGPAITCPAHVTVECNDHCGVPSDDPQLTDFFNGVSATDACGDVVGITDDRPGCFPLGTTMVVFTATDDSGNEESCSADVTVVDTTPPEITCPADVTVECNDHCGVPSDDPELTGFFNGVSASDACGDVVDITDDRPGCFPVGTTPVTFVATDQSGNPGMCEANVTVEDTTPPEISVTLNRYELWPPNHKMADIVATVVVEDICDPSPTFILAAITSNEPEDDGGDGSTVPDIQGADLGTADTEFQLRSERSGQGMGRIYTIVYVAEDASGNQAEATVLVRVPHDRSGVAFASTGFNEEGTGFDRVRETFIVIVPSRLGVYGIDENGEAVLVESHFDATLLDMTRAYVGNTQGAILPEERMEVDNDGDGLVDLVLTYPITPVEPLIEQVVPVQYGEMWVADPVDPVGLHFVSSGGVDYLVPDIFGLGEPVVLRSDVGESAGITGERQVGATALHPISPNPFGSSTMAGFSLAAKEHVALRIYDARGMLVRTLEDRVLPCGLHHAVWDGRGADRRPVADGVYFVRFSAGPVRITRKVMLLR
jgi:hypothetical protein